MCGQDPQFSDIFKLEMDEPSGRILSVTLFILKINSLAEVFNIICKQFIIY